MEWHELITDGYGGYYKYWRRRSDGLTPEDLNQQPHRDCNSMGWLTWPLTRVQDDHIADLMGEKQLWKKDEWHARFNRQPDAKDIGFGHTPKQVAAFKSPEVSTLLNYHKAVLERSKRYFLTLSDTELERELDEPWYQPLPTVGVRLISILADSLQHAGQMAYVRGLRQGKGWQKY